MLTNKFNMNGKLAIIDRGVDVDHKRLLDANISGVTVYLGKDCVSFLDQFKDDDGHGTAVAGIIHKTNPKIALVAVKLSTHLGIITEKVLCEGIKYCYTQRNDIKMINVSLGIGSSDISDDLRQACQNAKNKGITIISSTHNFPAKNCYPAYFPFVIGVATGILKQRSTFKFLGKGAINILAKGTVQRVPWKNGTFKISSGTSFASAHFSGLISKIIMEQQDPSFEFNEVLKLAKKYSSKDIIPLSHINNQDNLIIDGTYQIEDADSEALNEIFNFAKVIDSVAIFPASEKEIKTILEFEELSKYKISLVLDYPKKNSLGHINEPPSNHRVISTYLDEEKLNSFDTLVIGYFLDQPWDANIIYGMDLIEKCMLYNKNFFVFDRDVYKFISEKRKKYKSYTGRIIYPEINLNLLKKLLPFKYLEQVKCPILMVLGTGSRQGKVTTQLRIKSLMQSIGYKVGMLGTEPQTLIQGADFIFPFGHKSTVKLGLDYWTDLLGIVIKGIYAAKKPNIIITGGQGGLVKKLGVPSESGGNILKNLHFLMDVKPDAVILAINYNDSIDFIKRTIDTIKIFHDVQIPFMVLKPPIPSEISIKKLNTKEIIERFRRKKNSIEKEFSIPVLNIKAPNNDNKIIDLIQKTFS